VGKVCKETVPSAAASLALPVYPHNIQSCLVTLAKQICVLSLLGEPEMSVECYHPKQ